MDKLKLWLVHAFAIINGNYLNFKRIYRLHRWLNKIVQANCRHLTKNLPIRSLEIVQEKSCQTFQFNFFPDLSLPFQPDRSCLSPDGADPELLRNPANNRNLSG